MSIVLIALCGFYLTGELLTVYNMLDTRYTFSSELVNEDKNNDRNMDYFDDTFNIFFGMTDTELDLLDNPYFKPVVYEMDESRVPKPSKEIKLSKCKPKDL